MKIAIIGPAWPYRGGIAAFGERLAREFIREGHEVALFTFTLQYPKFLFPGKTQYSESPKPEDLKIERYINSVNPFTWHAPRGNRGAHVASGAEKFDLAIVAYWQPMMAPCLGAIARAFRRRGAKVVGLMHNVVSHEAKFYHKWLTKYFIKSVDSVEVMVEAEKQNLLQLTPGKKCLVSPHPIYDNYGVLLDKAEAARRLNLDPAYTYLLFFGLIRDYKGLDLLLDAFADTRIDKSRVKLIVAGEFYSHEEEYTQQLQRLNLGDSVVWHTRFIPDNEVENYFSLADLVVLPYKSATQSGITQIAYHFGKPMVVTNVGGLGEIVPNGKAGYVVEPTAAAIAAAVAGFCATSAAEAGSSAAQRFTQGIEEQKKKYAWSRMTATLLKLAE